MRRDAAHEIARFYRDRVLAIAAAADPSRDAADVISRMSEGIRVIEHQSVNGGGADILIPADRPKTGEGVAGIAGGSLLFDRSISGCVNRQP